MNAAQDPKRQISLRHAAKLIFKNANPTPEQIQRVQKYVATKALVGDEKGTTLGAVAKFLAEAARLHEQQGGESHGEALIASQADANKRLPNEEIEQSYRRLLTDYFLAVVARRKVRSHDHVFQRTVLVGQIGFLLLVLGSIAGIVFQIRNLTSPEQRAALHWLSENVNEGKVLQWHPPVHDPEDSSVIQMRVRYRYLEGRKHIETDRIFFLRDGEVFDVQFRD